MHCPELQKKTSSLFELPPLHFYRRLQTDGERRPRVNQTRHRVKRPSENMKSQAGEGRGIISKKLTESGRAPPT